MPQAQPFETLSLEQLRARTSVKWQHYPADVLPMWVAEMDVLIAPGVVAALQHAITTGDTGYPSGRGYQEQYGAFCARHWGWEPEMSAAFTVADVMTGIRETLAAATDPGDPVIIPTPVYPPFLSVAQELGREVIEVELRDDPATGARRLDLEAMSEALTASRGRPAILLCSPHNPTGTVHTRDELEALAAMAADRDAAVIVDEIHAPLTFAGGFVPYLDVPGTQSGVVITSASKSYNLAGLKAALVIPGTRAGRLMARVGHHVRYGASHLGILAHTEALRTGDEWLAGVNANIAANRTHFAQLLAGKVPGARAVPGDSTYLVWVDGTAAGLGDNPARELLRVGRLAVNPGHTFGAAGHGHFRVNVAASRALLADAVERIATTVAAGRTTSAPGTS